MTDDELKAIIDDKGIGTNAELDDEIGDAIAVLVHAELIRGLTEHDLSRMILEKLDKRFTVEKNK